MDSERNMSREMALIWRHWYVVLWSISRLRAILHCAKPRIEKARNYGAAIRDIVYEVLYYVSSACFIEDCAWDGFIN